MATKSGTKWVTTQLLQEISPRSLHLTGGFGEGLLDEDNLIPPRSSLVAMATKFETKLPITRLLYEISSRSLRLTGWERGLGL